MELLITHKLNKKIRQIVQSGGYEPIEAGYIVGGAVYDSAAGYVFKETENAEDLAELKQGETLTGDQVIDILLYLGYDLFPFY